jgi:predicted lipid-binding transport protein (Tim44 family)
MPTGVIELIILAGIAIFLLFRLRGVLGTKTGLEEQQASRVLRPEPTRAPRQSAPAPAEDDGGVDPDSATVAEGDDRIGAALAAMRRAEPGFLASEFMMGARQAFEMILMAYEHGDVDTLRRFLAPDVFGGFAQAIEQRKAEGLSVEAKFIGVRDARVVDARYNPATREAEIAIRFTAELISVVRDATNAVVEGDPNEVRRETDVWTFGRRMGVNDPNWTLVATGE